MDEGILTDNKGKKIPFHDAVVILTSNVGVEGIEEMKSAVGFTRQENCSQDVLERETLKSLEKTFRPEFLNRIDEVLCFNPLGGEECRKIVKNLLKGLKRNLSEMKISIRFSKGAIDFLMRQGTDPRYGARPLKRAIKQYIETPLTEKILQTPSSHPRKIQVKMSGGKVVFQDETCHQEDVMSGRKKAKHKRGGK
jgi:ATP-dependent Clp protease ATP-binding subunit ClpC